MRQSAGTACGASCRRDLVTDPGSRRPAVRFRLVGFRQLERLLDLGLDEEDLDLDLGVDVVGGLVPNLLAGSLVAWLACSY